MYITYHDIIWIPVACATTQTLTQERESGQIPQIPILPSSALAKLLACCLSEHIPIYVHIYFIRHPAAEYATQNLMGILPDSPLLLSESPDLRLGVSLASQPNF